MANSYFSSEYKRGEQISYYAVQQKHFSKHRGLRRK